MRRDSRILPASKVIGENQVSEHIQAKLQQAFLLHREGKFDRAELLYAEILKLQPRHFDALHLSGVIARQTGRFQQAVELIARALAIDPRHAAAFNNHGNALLDLKQYHLALQSYEQAVSLKPDYAEAFNNRGNVLQELGQFAAAIQSYDQAIAIKPNYAEAYYNRGNVLLDQNQLTAALASYACAIALQPDYAQAYNNRGNTLRQLKQPETALQNFEKAIALKPDYVEAYNNRGNVFRELKQTAAALQSYTQAIEFNPDYTDAYYNRANLLSELHQYALGLQDYDIALRLKPDYAQAYNNRGNLLKELKQTSAALDCYTKAIALQPDFADAYYNRGNALKDLKRYLAAVQNYDQVLKLKPDADFIYGYRLHCLMNICDWRGMDEDYLQLKTGIERGDRVCHPFTVLALSSDLSLQRKAAEIWRRHQYPEISSLPALLPAKPRDKIRIGYYSADFYAHATSYLIAQLFELQDRSRFELIGFAFGPHKNDAMRTRLAAAFDQFIDVNEYSDIAVAELSRELAIDIAIDLKAYTQGGRPGIFALRAAPIQVSYLGYPGTMAAEFIDYLIADFTLIPDYQRRHYAEKIVYLPNSYQVNDRLRSIADRVFTRSECGLPGSGFVFCCFNNNFKITPAVFACWMRILNRVAGSVLWLFQDNPTAVENLSAAAVQQGINAERLIFAQRLPLPEHLARHGLADLFLDTLPCNAHTTASDALWAGLPVLTCLGEAFAGRVAASLLNAVDMPELISASLPEYEKLAIELALNPEQLARIRRKLAANRLSKPLFQSENFTRHLETAFITIYARYQDGLLPDDIVIRQ